MNGSLSGIFQDKKGSQIDFITNGLLIPAVYYAVAILFYGVNRFTIAKVGAQPIFKPNHNRVINHRYEWTLKHGVLSVYRYANAVMEWITKIIYATAGFISTNHYHGYIST